MPLTQTRSQSSKPRTSEVQWSDSAEPFGEPVHVPHRFEITVSDDGHEIWATKVPEGTACIEFLLSP